MSISVDSVIIQNLERALNTDQNRHSDYIGNTIAELARAIASQPTFHDGTALVAPEIAVTRCVGLNVKAYTAGPRSLTVGVGALIANAGAEATPGGLSSWRIGLLTTDTNVTIPAADGLWYLLECRVAEAVVTENRDILTNPVTRTYAPSPVQVGSLKRIVFNVKVGAATIPAVTAGWTPIAGFLNAAPVPLDRLVDFRQPMRTDTRISVESTAEHQIIRRSYFTEARIKTSGGAGGLASSKVTFDFAAVVDGVLCKASSNGQAVELAPFIPGGAYGANAWHYIYLAPAPPAQFGEGRNVGNIPRAVNATQLAVANCVMVVSTLAPAFAYPPTGLAPVPGRNADPLALTAPMSGTIAVGRAVCVGALYYGVGTWLPMDCAGDTVRHQAIDALSTYAGVFNGVANHIVSVALPTGPGIERERILQVGMSARTPSQGAGAAGAKIMFAVNTATGQTVFDATPNEPSTGSVLFDPTIQEDFRTIVVPISPTGFGSTALVTRQANGTPWGGGVGFIQDAFQGGAVFCARLIGFRL